jgi:BirA family transcriptional regulator, biotin operon repressor / biotin---[acetyl-CoA-carboxylase] ligase
MQSLPVRNPFPGARSLLVASVGSTQAVARSLCIGPEGLPFGSLVAAEEQVAGRGRLPGRSWESARGQNLLFTMRLEPALASLPALPLRIGLALRDAVEAWAETRGAALPSPARIKWPNDLMLGDRKAAGILCEAGSSGLFAGIGLNCNQLSFPEALGDRATSLAIELGRPVDRWELLELFLLRLKDELGAEEWRSRVQARLWRLGEEASFLPGRPDACPPAAGGAPGVAPGAARGAALVAAPGLSGRVEGVDEAGSLLFRAEGETAARAWAAGELRSGGGIENRRS